MGLFDLIRGDKNRDLRPALEQADSVEDGGPVVTAVRKILEFGVDGAGPLEGSAEVAAKARADASSNEDAIDKVVRSHLATGAAGGFLTSLGGFITMPVALPLNVVEFYAQAARMVGAIAELRGYDATSPKIRLAILLTLIGSNADEVLAKAGMATGGGRLASLALDRLPAAGVMMINKGVGFQLMKGLGERSLSRLGRGVPLAGGVIGAGLDGYLMKKIADSARREFPKVSDQARPDAGPANGA